MSAKVALIVLASLSSIVCHSLQSYSLLANASQLQATSMATISCNTSSPMQALSTVSSLPLTSGTAGARQHTLSILTVSQEAYGVSPWFQVWLARWDVVLQSGLCNSSWTRCRPSGQPQLQWQYQHAKPTLRQQLPLNTDLTQILYDIYVIALSAEKFSIKNRILPNWPSELALSLVQILIRPSTPFR